MVILLEPNERYNVKKTNRRIQMFSVDKRFSKSNIARTIRFTEEIFNSLLEISDKEDISFNQLVLQCCQYAIDNYETKNKCIEKDH